MASILRASLAGPSSPGARGRAGPRCLLSTKSRAGPARASRFALTIHAVIAGSRTTPLPSSWAIAAASLKPVATADRALLAGPAGYEGLLEALHLADPDGTTDLSLDGVNDGSIGLGYEGKGPPGSLGAPGPADAVSVSLRGIGDVEVDDVGDLLDVDPPRHDVRGHEDVEASFSEAPHGPIPLGLGHVSLERDGPVT